MSKRTVKQAPATFVVDAGDNWRIEYDRFARDYAAWIGWDVIVFCKTQREAKVAIDQYRAEQIRQTDAPECDGLDYPCGEPATHEVRTLAGHDISGAQVVVTAQYCDAHYEKQASWEEDQLCDS